MNDFSIFGSNFDEGMCLSLVLIRCKEKNLLLNWDKCQFIVKSEIVLGHFVSEKGVKVDKVKMT